MIGGIFGQDFHNPVEVVIEKNLPCLVLTDFIIQIDVDG
jgi:hypothetical protein